MTPIVNNDELISAAESILRPRTMLSLRIIRSRRYAVVSFFLLACAAALFWALQVLTVNVPVEAPWVRVSLSVNVSLPFVALAFSCLALRYDHSKWFAWVVLSMSVLACIFLLLSGLIVLL